MNRLLLQECLDELRSDDSVELTESQKHPHGKKRNSPHHGNRAAPSLDGSSRGFPDSSRSTASSTPALTERRRQSIANVTNDVKRKILNYLNGDRKIDEKDYKRAIGDLRATFSLEYKGGSSYGPIATPSGIMGLRVADHRAVGEHFPQNEGDFYVSIYIGEGEAAHIPTAVPYKEFYCPKVLFDRNPKKVLRAAVGIVLNAIETGELVDKTATFTMKDYPVEVPQGAQAAIQTQAGLSPQPPATPPTGPEVQESLATKYFKEAHNMKYRLLKEAALRELMEEEDYIEHFSDWWFKELGLKSQGRFDYIDAWINFPNADDIDFDTGRSLCFCLNRDDGSIDEINDVYLPPSIRRDVYDVAFRSWSELPEGKPIHFNSPEEFASWKADLKRKSEIEDDSSIGVE